MNATEMIRLAAVDGAMLRRAVADAEIVPLILSLVQLTGDVSYLDEARPYIRGAWSYTQTIPKSLQMRVRASLVEAIERLAESGEAISDFPPDHLIVDMMEVATGHRLGDEYLGVFREETNFGEGDARDVEWHDGRPAEAGNRFVVVIGSGFSGVLAAIKLKRAGIPYVVIEKNDDVGGTWLENSYPGIGVDTPCHFYSYAFEPNSDWGSYFTEGAEILRYIRHCANKYGVMDAIRFGEEVTSAAFDESTSKWHVRTRHRDGTETTIEASAVISCVGALSRPRLPNLPGRDSFQGAAFHTACWDHSVDLADKRVVMIGTGASGMQVAPTIAPIVKHLTIVQRSPHWAIRHPLYHETVPTSVRWAMRHIPFYSNWFRFRLYFAASDMFHATLSMDPDWPHKDISLNAANHRMREELTTHIKDELSDRPDLWDKVIPNYPPFGKRLLRDNNWYKTLTRDNVGLVASGVDRIEPDAVIAGGNRYPADVIVYASGFEASRMLGPIDIRGRGGVSLREIWGDDDARAHYGITVPGFPNFFMCYGPNTNQAHGGSAVFGSEVQVRYIMLALRELIERGADSIEVRREPFEEYNRRVDAKLSTMSWSHPGVTNWFKNKSGRVVLNLPWRLVDYRNMIAEFDADEYVISTSGTTGTRIAAAE